jgi:CDP-paratose 2-epimerase
MENLERCRATFRRLASWRFDPAPLPIPMSRKTICITGSSGLIGSEVCAFFHERFFEVHGFDSNQRAVFFGPQGDTRWNQARLQRVLPRFTHHELDVRDRAGILALLKELRPSVIVHAAAQPSHDRSAVIAFDDFDTNAVGTMNLLEGARQFVPESPFIFMSTNKVYGDRPNSIQLTELPTRYEYDDPEFQHGIPETLPIDQSTHSPFGASKASADLMVQEYGRYFGMPTCCLRGGCLTGPNHSGVELHGFLSYLVKCNLEEREYRIYGYQGKQVRDNLHSEDVARFMYEFVRNPRSGEVYNLGGGKENACSILEAFEITKELSGKKMIYRYVDQARIGDHICYYSDLRKMKRDYPDWTVSISLSETIGQIVRAWRGR